MVVLITELRQAEEAKTPANESAVVDPGDAAVQVTEGFLDAFGTFDVERTKTYLAEDADITWMTEGKGVAGLDLMTSWLDATGYRPNGHVVSGRHVGFSGYHRLVRVRLRRHRVRGDRTRAVHRQLLDHRP